MNEPDPISEIELLSRNFLSQDSNLDEYEDVDTDVLSPRRVPIGRGMAYGIGTPGIPNVVTYDEVDDEEDNQTNSSGFSSSIQKTVQEIDGVLDEIRLRSSPDPNDFVFRSGNRQYYNGYYYDDDAMTEKSYLTNTNLHRELNEANKVFNEANEVLNDTITAMQDDEVGLLGDNQDAEDSEYDLENDTSFDLGWLRSKMAARNDEYQRRKNAYENNRIGNYENNHIDTYENNDVYSPHKTSHIEAQLGDIHNKNDSSFHQEWMNEGHESYPVEIQEDPDPRDYWNEMPDSEGDLEEALSRVNRGHRRREYSEESSSTSFFRSKIIFFWRRRRKGHRYQLQSEELEQQHQGQQHPHREELSFSTTNTPSSSSRKQTRLLWAAIGCSTVAIVFVTLAVLFMTTATSWSSFIRWKKPTFAVGSNDPIHNIDSNNTHVNSTTIIFVDDAATVPTVVDLPTILPTAPTMPSIASTAPTEAPTAPSTRSDSTQTGGAGEHPPPTTSPPPTPVPVSTVSALPVSGGSKPGDHPQQAAGSAIQVDRPVHGKLPVSGVATSTMHYVSSNQKPASSDILHVSSVEEINSIVIDNISDVSSSSSDDSEQPQASPPPPVVASLPVSGHDPVVDARTSGSGTEVPTSAPTKFEKHRSRRRLKNSHTKSQKRITNLVKQNQ